MKPIVQQPNQRPGTDLPSLQKNNASSASGRLQAFPLFGQKSGADSFNKNSGQDALMAVQAGKPEHSFALPTKVSSNLSFGQKNIIKPVKFGITTRDTGVDVRDFTQNIHPPPGGSDWIQVCEEYTPELEAARKKILERALERGLRPCDTQFWLVSRDTHLKTAAQGGFPVAYDHWSHAQEFHQLNKSHEYGLSKIYEMVINTVPSMAYLLIDNDVVDQKLVIAHVFGHTDFFTHNKEFKYTDRDMLDRQGIIARRIKAIQREHNITDDEMEAIIDKIKTFDDLIDRMAGKPRDLFYKENRPTKVEPLPDDYGRVDTTGQLPHVDRIVNSPELIAARRAAEQKRREDLVYKVPLHPDSDVMGVIMENSPLMREKPYLREIMGYFRELAYYFNPQGKTKIMNEGWATFWHLSLMAEEGIMTDKDIVDVCDHTSGTIANHKGRMNPYRLGLFMMRDIKERWDKGRHGAEYNKLKKTDPRAWKNYDDKSMKGMEKLFEVRKNYNDYTFIETFLTEEFVRKHKLFQWKDDGKGMARISTREFEEVKKQLLASLENGMRPRIKAVDANFKHQDELVLEHTQTQNYPYLKQDYSESVLGAMYDLWGRPVHLNSWLPNPKPTEQNPDPFIRVRITVKEAEFVDEKKKYRGLVAIWHRLTEDGEDIKYQINREGEKSDQKYPIERLGWGPWE